MCASARPVATVRRWSALVVVLALLVGACGPPGPGDEPGGPDAPPATDEPTGPDEPEPEALEVEVEVFFTNDSDTLRGDLCLDVFPVTRTVSAADPVTGAIAALLAGPTAAERAQGYRATFAEYAEGALRAVEVRDGTATLTLTDLRDRYTHGHWCTAVELLTSLDHTLLAFEHIEAARYTFAGAQPGAFYRWLHLTAPDARPPDAAEPSSGDPVDLDAGWSRIEPTLPVQLGCCGLQTTGPVSPEGPLPADGWPDDGYYDVDLYRPAHDPSMLQLTVRRWIACGDLPQETCSPDPAPEPGEPDLRITPDPAGAMVRWVPVTDLEVILYTIGEPEVSGSSPLRGEAPAFATLLADGLDPAFRRWVEEPLQAGASLAEVDDDLRRLGGDPTFPLGSPRRYRGPLDSWLVLLPSFEVLHLWPHGWDGLYDWHATLEIRDGTPLLHVFAGQIAG
jgi:hypothetical protein